MTTAHDITVLVIQDRQDAKAAAQAIRRSQGPLLLVLSPNGLADITTDSELSNSWFRDLHALNRDRSLMVATKHKATQAQAAAQGWQTVTSIKKLRLLLAKHPSKSAAVRIFSPSAWRQDIRTKLQFVGLLSLPKLRIWLLLALSAGVFGFIFIKLLPSAEIRIWPNQESENYTMNVFLAASGAVLPVPTERVRTLPLVLQTVSVERTITIDQISKNFTGTNAEVWITVFNDADEQYSLRKGTRLANQAGMRFRLQEDLVIPPHSKHEVRTMADPLDQYGEVVGDRGNVPAGLKWEFPGLSEAERKLVYGRNERPGSKGTTSYQSIVRKEDIEAAKKKLQQELLAVAKQLANEERISRNNAESADFVQLNYDELTRITYTDFDLSESFVNQSVQSFPVSGKIEYTVLLYDESKLLNLLTTEVRGRSGTERMVIESSLNKDNMSIHVIAPWDDNLFWVKLTADLTYTQRYLLNPITPNGAKFGKYIRDSVAGKTQVDALRIIKNLPEVARAEISIWPPWADVLPAIGSNIVVSEQAD